MLKYYNNIHRGKFPVKLFHGQNCFEGVLEIEYSAGGASSTTLRSGIDAILFLACDQAAAPKRVNPT
jgi:hypothetical protein